MDAEETPTNLATGRSFTTHLLNLPPHPKYESAGGLSTRMIIDSASYTTTPCSSPPPEASYVFSAHDTHGKVPDIAALTEANHVLERQLHQTELGHYITNSIAQSKSRTLHISENKDHTSNDRTWHHQGVVPPYILHAIATSEAAGSQARASAEQTLLSSKPARRDRTSMKTFDFTAPAQRQLEDGRWTTVL